LPEAGARCAKEERMALITPQQVADAYAALATGQRDLIAQHFAEDMRWLVPGHNQLSGWKNTLEEFIAFMARVGELSDNSFQMRNIVTMTADNYSADVTANSGHRSNDPARLLEIDVIHWMQWRDGRVIHARGAIFGDGTAQYDAFWA
jgi:ketosteroid isomerase-like protein